MRPSQLKHPVAVLRTMLGLRQKEFADVLALSVESVQSIETKRMKLSPETAVRISNETGADVGWLLRGIPSNPIDSKGKPLSAETFATIQTFGKAVVNDPAASYIQALVTTVEAMRASMYLFLKIRGPKAALLQYRIAEKFQELCEEFVPGMVEHLSVNAISAAAYATLNELKYPKAQDASDALHALGHEIDRVMRKGFVCRGWLPADVAIDSDFAEKFEAKLKTGKGKKKR